MKEVEIHGKGLDQPSPITSKDLEESFKDVDNVIETAIEEGSPERAFAYGRVLITSAKLRGVALMRLLYHLSHEWSKFGLLDTFADRVFDEWGFSRQTVSKYIDIWGAVFENKDVPAYLHPPLLEKPVNTLGKLVRPVNEGKLTDEKDWKRIAYAPDDVEVASIVKEISGTSVQGRKALKIFLYQDGRLVAMQDTEQVTLGILRNSPEDLKDKLRSKAMERIRNSVGVIEL